ncbi:MAG: pyridoxamine 5'-phosphate oxidase, partial [Nocardia sp.]|nr:pyridoxamine 5'-phosphate oxidase [Nocardia sp.]
MREQQNSLDIAAMRVEYGVEHGAGNDGPFGLGPAAETGRDSDLTESWLANGWEPLLRTWIEDATSSGITEPNAMVLATVELTDDGPRPASRTVLCKGLSPEGVTFYTNYDSGKGIQLQAVPYASTTFAWPELARQVTLRGRVEQVSREVTEVYWRSRPRDSQLGAWASHQSQPVVSRAALDRAYDAVIARFEDVDRIPVPANWGGFVLRPDQVEFWQGRRGRLHNRIRMTLPEGPVAT